ncbi:MAG: 50S ribosomal protein P1 [Candidatus Nanoarchaeia archaeon]|nr:50S ribosomal protein P1 [Candidatus Nanoarchaeia archaeon]MDD5054555.1 50S ribosomal protein P1 [Candidatus Nanoarchaeia archaeon]MDD5499435.1 50S ribosomal protein P1 [Candidatus Nanoarchaeia archaeon]
MEYIYSALLLNSAGKEIKEETVKKVLESAGITPDEAKLKALVASLDGVDIKEAISKSASIAAVSAPSAPGAEKEAKKEEEEEEVSTEEAAAGLGALFG